MKASLWHATVGGALFGLFVGTALQIGWEIQQQRALARLIEEFAPWSPPQMAVLLRPHVIPVAVCLLFSTLGSFVYMVRSRFRS